VFAAADRAHQQQNALAHLEPLGCRAKVLDQLLQGLFNAENVVLEEAEYLAAVLICTGALTHDHVMDSSVGQARDLGLGLHELEVLQESPFPGQPLLFRPKLGEPLFEVHPHPPPDVHAWVCAPSYEAESETPPSGRGWRHVVYLVTITA